jgi:copper(I)-binding protein
MKRILCALALWSLSGMAPTAWAHDYTLGDIAIGHPWARASIGQAKAGAAYLTLSNAGSETDRLVAVETPVAKKAQVHTHSMENGVMKMRPVEAAEVPPSAAVMFQPGGLHVMLMGLKAPLVEGESFPLVLIFEKAGRIEIMVAVQPATSTEPTMEHKHGS